MTATKKSRADLVVERTYEATQDEVWSLWTTREGFESWWGPVGFHVKVHTLEAKLGGKLHYDMIADAPEAVSALAEMDRPDSHETRGTFSRFQPQEALELTHIIDFIPGVTPYESTIGVQLFPRGDTVRMVVTLSPMHDEMFTGMQLEGFTSQLTKLDGRFKR